MLSVLEHATMLISEYKHYNTTQNTSHAPRYSPIVWQAILSALPLSQSEPSLPAELWSFLNSRLKIELIYSVFKIVRI